MALDVILWGILLVLAPTWGLSGVNGNTLSGNNSYTTSPQVSSQFSPRNVDQGGSVSTSPQTLDAVTPKVLDNVTVKTLDGVTPQTLDGVTPQTLDGVTPQTLDGVTPQTLDGVTPQTLDGVTPQTLDAVTPRTLDGVSPQTLDAVTPGLPIAIPFPEEKPVHYFDEIPQFVTICTYCMPEFRGGPDFFLSMSKWSNLVCGQSFCNRSLDLGRCGNTKCDECYCDSHCVRYGDCCPDFYLTSPYQPPQATFSCIRQAFISSKKAGHKRYKMVRSCPLLDTPTEDEKVTQQTCYNPDPTQIENNIPVYSALTELHYRNDQCAKCNGISDGVAWEVKPFCQDYVDFSGVSSPDDLLSLLRREDKCAVHFIPPKSAVVRECIEEQDTIRTCNVTGQWDVYNADIERACGLYSQPVMYDGNNYENIFCVNCNGYELNSQHQCEHPIVVPENAPFSVLFDVRQSAIPQVKDQQTVCPDTRVFDPFAKICRPLVCPVGKFPRNHTCSSLLNSAQGLGYILHFSLTPKNQEFIRITYYYDIFNVIMKSIQEHTFLFRPIFWDFYAQIKLQTVNGSSEARVYEIDVQYAVVVGAVIPKEEAERRLVGLLTRRWWLYENEATSPVYMDFTWRSTVSDERLRWKYYNYGPVKLEPIGEVRIENVSISEEAHFQKIPPDFRMNTSSYILVSDLLMCNMIELNTSEYTVVNSSRVLVHSSGQTLNEGQFLWKDDRVRVCTNWTGEIQNSAGEKKTPFDLTEVTLTLVCTCLSLCGLFVTLVIYLAMPSIRARLPGKNNMFLFCNLFLAQLLFLTGSSADVSTSACRALAILIHYFWLSTFSWKLTCAYHMYRLFTNPLKALDQKKSLIKYVLFSQLCPGLLILLIVSVNLAESDLARIGYADRPGVCFLSSNLDIGLGFVAPVGLVIVVNTYFFSRVVYALRHRPKLSQHVRKSDVKETIMYFKMSLILGFTWVLGFVAIVVYQPGMWYVFTIVNSSIGVFVFISFGMKNLSPSFLARGHFTEDMVSATNGSKTYETSTGSISKVPLKHILGDSPDSNRNSPRISPELEQSRKIITN